MLKVLKNNKFTRTRKADAVINYNLSALAAVSKKVFMIAGFDIHTQTHLATVSYYEISKNTWTGLEPKLNIARSSASACALKGKVYVFCGSGKGKDIFLNSIEMISETSLVQDSTATWQLIKMPQEILIPRWDPAVAPLNGTEITIMGGYAGKNRCRSDVVVFNTTTKNCQIVTDDRGYEWEK